VPTLGQDVNSVKRPTILSIMLAIVAGTDMVAMVPERIVRGNPALKVMEPPLPVPGYEMAMLWHERRHRDPAHQWLRDHIAAAVRV